MSAPYRTTAEFDETTLPAALRREHRTKAGVWGVVRVIEGTLALDFADGRRLELTPDKPGVLRPEELHWVTPGGSVRMRVEFFDAPPALS